MKKRVTPSTKPETAKAYQSAHEGMELATKQDLKELEQTLSYKIELVRADTATAIEKSQNKLIFWMSGIVTVGVSVILCYIEHNGKL